ncbi:hypothetical protein SAMN02745146_0756 [Hymenobacter daecheongensis DSM 21074]|uniref:Uncharacterized protein n=2 Tax=Hymenobacter daecheongensis TaxID=496053 RepID=A0A1M6ATW5_9BACT|nr:hypothetical protein SAMN02745146_0756 [Hymenobacter daecheongensis DSM 21074]
MFLADAQPGMATPPGSFLFRSKGRIAESSHTHNYKKYRGNSRHKARKLGAYKRWRLRCKAKHKARLKAQPRIGRTTL